MVAAIVGALVMGVAMLALAACLVVLLPRRIGWGMFATAVWGAAFFGLILRERIPPEMWQTASRGFIEKRMISMLNPETRRTLDLLAPSGMSWGVAWWAAVAWIFGGTLLVMGASSEVGYYLMIIGFITAIPAFGGNWRLMQEQGTGWLALQQWVILPFHQNRFTRRIDRGRYDFV